jgi:flagellar hook-length control protein FliK
VSAELLATAADSALLSTDDAGTTSFDIAFDDELFADLACRISVSQGRVVATFRVRDVNLRRLLEAETPRLRARLEERGLKVGEVRVEME